MTSSVLYDAPGPSTTRRFRVYGGVSSVVIALLLAAVLLKLSSQGQFDADKWDAFTDPSTWRQIRTGFRHTLQTAATAVALSLLFGAVLAAGRLSDRPWLRWPSTVVVEFFRAVPLVLLILFLFLGYGSTIGVFWSLVIGLVLYNGSVLAEIFRAGIASVPKGQREAGLAVGLTQGQVLRIVLLPQAVRTMLPAIIGQSVVALKDTTLGYIISYEEAAFAAKLIYVFYDNPLQAGVVTAVIFILINYTLSKLAVWLEGRQRRTLRSDAPVLAAGDPRAGGPGGATPD